jgi:rfaE bifunctional protein kinase chain/domain
MISRQRLEEILSAIPTLRMAVVGDFFLDKYLVTDPALSEISLETGLEARQVVAIRCSPGAAGTVTNNLSALGVGRIYAVGAIGEEGEGFDLLRGLRETGVDTRFLLATASRFTPTYMKPMRRADGEERELERLDIKNRSPLDAATEERLIGALTGLLDGRTDRVDAVIVADQVEERNCGVVTDRMRLTLAQMAQTFPEAVFLADSRRRIGEFQNLILKPNRREAAQAVGIEGEISLAQAQLSGMLLAARTGRPVFLTLGAEGILACGPEGVEHVPALPVRGPIDIVGAGDSVTAGIVCALCAGASNAEAAALGSLCASITIHKLGTTGTASPEELCALRETISI